MIEARYNVEIVWRYVQGHRDTAIHNKLVRARSLEGAEAWAVKSLKRKFTPHEIEILSVKGVCQD